MSGSSALPPIQIKVDGAQTAQQAIDGMVAAADRLGAAGTRVGTQLGTLRTQTEAASGATRNLGQVIGQAGYQVQDFAVQVASGQSALTAFVQQGSQLAGIFGPGGIIAGAALAIGGVAAQLLFMGDSGAAATKKIEDGFRASRQAGLDFTQVVQGLSAELLTAAERASRLANAQRDVLLTEGNQNMMRLTNEQTAAASQYTAAQTVLARIARSRAQLEADLAAASPRNRDAIASDLREVRASEFSARSRYDAAVSEMNRTGTGITTLRELLDRVGNIRTGPEELGPPAPERRRRGGGTRLPDPELQAGWLAVQDQNRDREAADNAEARAWDQEQARREREDERTQQRMVDANRRTTDRIVDYGANAFADMFDQNSKGWEGMLDTFASTFTKLIARLAAEAIIRPVIEPIVSSLGLGGLGTGNGGLSGIFGGTTTSTTSGGASTGGLGGLLGSVTGGGRSSGGGLLSSVGSIINSPVWTSGGGWFSAGAVAAPSIAGMSVDDAMASLPATPTTATTGYGAIGSSSLGAYAAGIGGGYMAGSTVGGLLAGQSKARQQNAQIGAVGGAVIGGAVFGPVGALAGGAIGGAVGGMIGPGKGFSGGDVGVAVDANGYLTIGRTGGKNWNGAAARDQTTAGLNSINDILRATGISISGMGGAQLGYQGYGGSARQFGATEIFGSVRGSLTSSNSTIAAALSQPWLQSFEDIGVIAPYGAQNDNLTRALGSGGIRSRDDFNNASTFITQIYEPMIKAAESTDTFAEAIAAQNKVYDDAIAKARELGLAESSLTMARDRTLAETLAARNTSVHNTVAGLTIEELERAGKTGQAAMMSYAVGSSDRKTQLSDFLKSSGYGEGTSLYQESMARLQALITAGRKDVVDQVNEQRTAANSNLRDSITGLRIGELQATGKPADSITASLLEFDVNAQQRRLGLLGTLSSAGFDKDSDKSKNTIARLNELLATQRRQLREQQEESASSSGRSLMEDLTIGGLGGLTSAGRYAAASKAYTAARQTGDLDRITAAGRNLATIGRDYLGTSERFGGLVADISRDVRRAGGDPTGLGVFLEGQAAGNQTLERIYNLSGAQVTELKGMRSEISRLNAVINTLIQRGKVAA